MLRKILFLCLMLNLTVGVAMGQGGGDYTKLSAGAKISDHVGKKVKLGGKSAQTVGQHPVLVAPAGVGKKEIQSYLDTKFGQIVLISGEDIKCPGKIKVFGKLEKVSLGGEKGTKGSYEGYVIRVDKFKCK
jgi:hypothetical protein